MEYIERKCGKVDATITSGIQSLLLFDHFFCLKNASILICLSGFEFGDLFTLPFLQVGEKYDDDKVNCRFSPFIWVGARSFDRDFDTITFGLTHGGFFFSSILHF